MKVDNDIKKLSSCCYGGWAVCCRIKQPGLSLRRLTQIVWHQRLPDPATQWSVSQKSQSLPSFRIVELFDNVPSFTFHNKLKLEVKEIFAVVKLWRLHNSVGRATGWNPVGASEYFLGFICNSLSYFTTAKISFTSILYPQFTQMIFIIYTSRQTQVDKSLFQL